MSYEKECKDVLKERDRKIKQLEKKYFTKEYDYLCTGNEYTEELKQIDKETDYKIKKLKEKYGSLL